MTGLCAGYVGGDGDLEPNVMVLGARVTRAPPQQVRTTPGLVQLVPATD